MGSVCSHPAARLIWSERISTPNALLALLTEIQVSHKCQFCVKPYPKITNFFYMLKGTVPNFVGIQNGLSSQCHSE